MIAITKAQEAFSEIYAKNIWGGSGLGSDPNQVQPYVAILRNFLKERGIKSVVDFGCGDWQFSQTIDWTSVDYTGFDVVPSVIEANQAAFGAPNIRFRRIAPGVELPKADLLICKDVLQHLPTADVKYYLDTFKRLYRWLLITNDIAPERGANTDTAHGGWRPIHLAAPPFNEAASEVVCTWDIVGPEYHWIKETRLIQGAPSGALDAIALVDPSLAPPARAAAARRDAIAWTKDALRKTPLWPLVRALTRWDRA